MGCNYNRIHTRQKELVWSSLFICAGVDSHNYNRSIRRNCFFGWKNLGILLDVEIALFGCVFAVYSILLAFLSDEYVKKLLEIDYYRQTNYLRKSTKYYEAALFIYFVAIGISLVYKLTIECMPQNFALINSELANEIVAGVLLFPYFAYSLRTIYELKSIVGNTLLLFRASIQYKIIAFVKEDKEEKRKAEEGVGIK